jgi:para-nitrobenzyl esterase
MTRRAISRREFAAGLAALAVAGRRLAAQDAETVVLSPCGALRGRVEEGVRVFRGVPFAQPPVNELRFRPPLKAMPWKGTRDAARFAPAAMQDGKASMSEDCLYLDVYAPGDKHSAGLPVFVWIHGGGNVAGSSQEARGAAFARDGVVCVALNYRLGVLGFLEMEPLLGASYAGSANNGVRDLIAGLAWVRENIAAFGGDPAKVTIGGQSAGAKLTDTLLGVAGVEAMFGQAVSESGGAERVWAKAGEAHAVGAAFGVVWTDAKRLLTAPAEEMIEAQKEMLKAWPHGRPLRPMVDGELIGELPIAAMQRGSARGKRLLIGTNREESAAFLGPRPQLVKAQDLMSLTKEKFDGVEAGYAALYPDLSEERRRVRAVSAEEYWVPSVRVADAVAEHQGKVWMYLLEFTEESGRLGEFAYHSEEMAMVWGRPRVGIAKAAAEARLASQLHAAWVSFVKGRVPGAEGLPAWPEYTARERETMVIDRVSRVERRPQEAELRLWDGVF